MNKRREIPTLLGLIIIAVAIVIFFGGTFTYEHFAIKEFERVIKPENQTTGFPMQILATKGWKTYTNTQYGVSFKYPSSWIYQTFNFNIAGVAFCPASLNCGVQVEGTNLNPAPIIFYFYEGDPTLLTHDLIKSYFRLFDSKYKEIYDQMLSTFKFTK